MAVHQLRTAALENRPDSQEEKMNLSRGRKRTGMSWVEIPIRAESAIRREGRPGEESVSCPGRARQSVLTEKRETVGSQAVELGWTEKRKEARKETG